MRNLKIEKKIQNMGVCYIVENHPHYNVKLTMVPWGGPDCEEHGLTCG